MMIAHLAEPVKPNARKFLLRLCEPKSKDVASLLRGEKAEFGAMAADDDVEGLSREATSRSSHARDRAGGNQWTRTRAKAARVLRRVRKSDGVRIPDKHVNPPFACTARRWR